MFSRIILFASRVGSGQKEVKRYHEHSDQLMKALLNEILPIFPFQTGLWN